MDSELDRTLNQWDEKSCAEFETYLDDVFPEESPEERREKNAISNDPHL